MNFGIAIVDNHIHGINFANCFCCSIFISIILAALLLKKRHTSEIRSFIFFSFFTVAAIWTDFIGYMCSGNELFVVLNYVTNICSYSFSALSACSYYTYLLAYYEERGKKIHSTVDIVCAYAYAVICSVIYTSSIWTGTFFTIDSNNVYHGTDLSFITGMIAFPLLFSSVYVILKNRKYTSTRDMFIHLMYILLYTILGFIDAFYIMTFHYIVMTIFIILIYIFIGQERDKELEIKQKELAVSELNALRLQMNPHFIYNTLASIDGLVVMDPASARQLIAKFTKHMRSSYLDSSPTEVEFEKELENIKCYLSVEEVRFPDIKVEYDLKVTDFAVPPLTVQPIIENAVKHGICKKNDSSGTIVISTFDDNANYYIRITDDGVGFDSDTQLPNDGRSHLGIANTRKRLELICNGTLEITGKPGIGTEAVITIPKENL